MIAGIDFVSTGKNNQGFELVPINLRVKKPWSSSCLLLLSLMKELLSRLEQQSYIHLRWTIKYGANNLFAEVFEIDASNEPSSPPT